MDKFLASLSEPQVLLSNQNEALRVRSDEGIPLRCGDQTSPSNSVPITPATDAFPSTAPTTRPASAIPQDCHSDHEEVLRLQLQLAQAQSHISKLDHELSQTRTVKPDSEVAIFGGLQPMGPTPRGTAWAKAEDTHSDTSEAISASAFSRARSIWGPSKASLNFAAQTPQNEPASGTWMAGRNRGHAYPDPTGPYPVLDAYRGDRLTPDSDLMMRSSCVRRGIGRLDARNNNSTTPLENGFGGYSAPLTHYETLVNQMSAAPMNSPSGLVPLSVGPGGPQYQQQSLCTPLSPYASEFTSKAGWKSEVGSRLSFLRRETVTDHIKSGASEGPTYLPPTEPLNYRRLLDRNVNCNWKYIVDKIVCNNDQQASIFLQQKLKVGTPEQKYEIVEAIVAQAYPLMINRFGNFLVQRCFEHGTPEQVIKIAEAIRGNTLNLSMDPFGCHVVQKAFDSVPEDYKAIMVNELLRRIPETVIHRYACHVWQKLFELRWTESPPQIMKYVNEALRGMWHEVALGETGSLVVQNIFENCLEEDKASLCTPSNAEIDSG